MRVGLFVANPFDIPPLPLLTFLSAGLVEAAVVVFGALWLA